jgi:hypothetical protein
VRAGAWSPAVVSDAAFAVDAALKRAKPAVGGAGSANRVEVTKGPVTAVAFAASAGAIVLGCADGSIWLHSRPSGETQTISQVGQGGPVRSLAVDERAYWVVALREREDGFEIESWFRTSAGWRRTERRNEACAGEPLLLAQVLNGHLFLWNGAEIVLLRHHLLIPAGSVSLAETTELTALLPPPPTSWEFANTKVLVLEGGVARLVDVGRGSLSRVSLGWSPAKPPCWLWAQERRLELTGLGSAGTLFWSKVELEGGALSTAETRSANREEGYLAACLVKSELVAGVGERSVDWLRAGGDGLTRAGVTLVAAPGAIACVALPGARELAIACANGTVVLVPLWR